MKVQNPRRNGFMTRLIVNLTAMMRLMIEEVRQQDVLWIS